MPLLALDLIKSHLLRGFTIVCLPLSGFLPLDLAADLRLSSILEQQIVFAKVPVWYGLHSEHGDGP